MDLLHPEFVSFITCANKNKLRYLLIGGYAVNYYGYNRNTNDLDVWIAPTNENKQLFINTLLCMKYSLEEVSYLHNEDFTIPFMVEIGIPGADIDIMTYADMNMSFDELENEKQTFMLTEDIPMYFVSYNHLLKLKIRASRPKDLWDIEQLEKIRKNFEK